MDIQDLFGAANWVYKIQVALYVGAACALAFVVAAYLFT
jgi:hypothetical protein